MSCCVRDRPPLPSATLASIFAVDSLLDFVAKPLETLEWSELNDVAKKSECTLLPYLDVRSILTPAALEEVLEQPKSASERVYALFTRHILDMKRAWCEITVLRILFHKAVARKAWCLAHALLESARRHNGCVRPRFTTVHLMTSRRLPIEPSFEYCSLLLALSPRANILMHGCANAHQFCRLLVAIRYLHPAALVWLESIRLLDRTSLVWWVSEFMCTGVTAVSPTVLAHVTAFAALAGNNDFVRLALELHASVLEHETWVFSYTDVSIFPPPLPLQCPFTTQQQCCHAHFDASAVACATSALPQSLHAHISFIVN